MMTTIETARCLISRENASAVDYVARCMREDRVDELFRFQREEIRRLARRRRARAARSIVLKSKRVARIPRRRTPSSPISQLERWHVACRPRGQVIERDRCLDRAEPGVVALWSREVLRNVLARVSLGLCMRAVRGVGWWLLAALACGAGWFAPAALASGGISWGSPVTVDHVRPYASGFGVSAVSCPSASFCAAIDWGFSAGTGGVAVSDDPSGPESSWTRVFMGPHFDQLSCASQALCVAVARNGDVLSSSDPAGGARTWRIAHVARPSDKASDVGAFDGVSCPAVALCVAVDGAGDVITSSDPTGGAGAWRIDHIAHRGISAVSCASAALCVAVDIDGDVLSSTDPTGGVSAWSAAHVYGGALHSVSCPSVLFCIATGGGDVLTSMDPQGGAGAWQSAHIDNAEASCGHDVTCPAELFDVSCASAQLCISTDDAGQAFGSTDPRGGPSAWKTLASNGGQIQFRAAP